MPTTMCKYHCITAQWALAAVTENKAGSQVQWPLAKVKR